jgi:hypothetical protein
MVNIVSQLELVGSLNGYVGLQKQIPQKNAASSTGLSYFKRYR